MSKLSSIRLVHSTLGYLRDPAVPLWRKLVGVLGVAYVVWPLDLIPDVIPVLGWLDDLGIFAVAAWFVVREVRRHAKRVEAARAEELSSMAGGIPEKHKLR